MKLGEITVFYAVSENIKKTDVFKLEYSYPGVNGGFQYIRTIFLSNSSYF